MTIKEYLESIGKTEFLEKWSEHIRQVNPQNLLTQIQISETSKVIGDQKIIAETDKIIKDLTYKMGYLHYGLLKATPVCKAKIALCESDDDFYNYLRGKDKYLFASLTDDCLYPDEIDKTKETLEIYLENWNILIKNGNTGDKNTQLSAYTRIQQQLINQSIDHLIKTTKEVSEGSNKTARIALWIAGITGIGGLVFSTLSYFGSIQSENIRLNNLTGLYLEVQNIGNTIQSFSGKYNQESIEIIMKDQTTALKNLENIYNKQNKK